MAILPENETYDFESRTYINPQVSLNEQNAFVDNLRNVQKENTNQINMQTYNLGTAVPSSVGGLTGANSYFSSRYQTPQMNSLAANLRATAQAKALNDVLANEQAKMQKRYNDAYNASQIRSTNTPEQKGGTGNNNNEKKGYVLDNGGWVTNKNMVPGSSRIHSSYDGYIYTQDILPDGRIVISNTDNPAYVQADNGYYYKVDTGKSYLGGLAWRQYSDKERKELANQAAGIRSSGGGSGR